MKKRVALFALSVMMICMSAMKVSQVMAAIPDYTEVFYVNDYANVLTDETVMSLAMRGADLWEKTGAELVVVVTEFTDGMTIDDYAYEVFKSWELGDPEKNNGLLLVLSLVEEDYYLEPGSGLLDKKLVSSLENILYDYLEEDFAVADYDAGLLKVYEKLADRLESAYYVSPISGNQNNNVTDIPPAEYNIPNTIAQTSPEQSFSFTHLFVVFVFVLFLSIIISSMSRRSYGRGWGGTGWGGMGRPYRRSIWWSFGRSHHHRHHHDTHHKSHHSPSHKSNSGGHGTTIGRGFSGKSGGMSRGGGIGRSSGMGSSRGGGFGGFGGRSGGGGGMSRGGGIGRRK